MCVVLGSRSLRLSPDRAEVIMEAASEGPDKKFAAWISRTMVRLYLKS